MTPTKPQTIFDRHVSAARSDCRGMPAVFTSASGSELRDDAGRSYVDFLAGCSSLNYGHNEPDMKAVLIDHIASDDIAHGLDLHTDAKGTFLDALETHFLAPRDMDHQVIFTGPTGANAVEAAMKIARKVTGRTNIIAFTDGFHGVTEGALAATGNSYHRAGAGMALGGVTRMPFDGYLPGDTDSADFVEAMLSDNSFEGMGVTPDIVTMAKSLSGFGLPMALLLVRPEHDVFGPAEHNGTLRGNTHAFVTARIAIEKFWGDDNFQRDLGDMTVMLTAALTEEADLVPGAKLKGRGLLQGADLVSGALAGEICARDYDKGLVIETSGNEDQVVKALTPLTTPEETFRKGFGILLDATRDTKAERVKLAAE